MILEIQSLDPVSHLDHLHQNLVLALKCQGLCFNFLSLDSHLPTERGLCQSFRGFGRSTFLSGPTKRHNLLVLYGLMHMIGKAPYHRIKCFVLSLSNTLTKVIPRILGIVLFDLLAKWNSAEQITQLQPHLLSLLDQLSLIWELFHPNCSPFTGAASH